MGNTWADKTQPASTSGARWGPPLSPHLQARLHEPPGGRQPRALKLPALCCSGDKPKPSRTFQTKEPSPRSSPPWGGLCWLQLGELRESPSPQGLGVGRSRWLTLSSPDDPPQALEKQLLGPSLKPPALRGGAVYTSWSFYTKYCNFPGAGRQTTGSALLLFASRRLGLSAGTRPRKARCLERRSGPLWAGLATPASWRGAWSSWVPGWHCQSLGRYFPFGCL